MPTNAVKRCLQRLYGNGNFRAICTQPYGTEHSHHDYTPEDAVLRGLAQPSRNNRNEDTFDRATLADFVAAHGAGSILTDDGVALARLMWKVGDDYATIAFELVYRGHVTAN